MEEEEEEEEEEEVERLGCIRLHETLEIQGANHIPELLASCDPAVLGRERERERGEDKGEERERERRGEMRARREGRDGREGREKGERLNSVSMACLLLSGPAVS